MQQACNDPQSAPTLSAPSGLRMQGFFQPIAGMPYPGSATGLPRHVELLHSVFSLRGDPQAMLGVSRCSTLASS